MSDVDEGFLDFHRGQWQIAEQYEGRECGAVVVHGDPDPGRPELPELSDRPWQVRDRGTLGDFDLDEVGGNVVSLERVNELGHDGAG